MITFQVRAGKKEDATRRKSAAMLRVVGFRVEGRFGSPTLCKTATSIRLPLLFMFLLAMQLFGSVNAEAQAIYYVRSGSAGNNSGLDWTNAFTSLPPTLVRGATYYVAEGSYPAYTFDDPTDGTKYITVKKATPGDHGTEVGWQNSYGDGVAQWTPPIKFKGNYYVFDGVTGGGPGSWSSGHGFKIFGTDDIILLMFSDKYGSPSDRVSVSNVVISHVDIGGNYPVAGIGQGIDATAYQAQFSNITISYCYVHDIGDAMFIWQRTTNTTLEYSYVARNASSNASHGTGFRMDDSRNITIKNCVFEDIVGTGFVGGYDVGVDNVNIFGNVFTYSNWNLTTNEVGCCYGNGVIYSIGASGPISNWKIYNNTFVNLPENPTINIYNSSGNNVAYNNLYFQFKGTPSFQGVSRDYDYFSNPSGGFSESNSQNGGNTDPLIDWASKDFRLRFQTASGVSLSAPYNVDPLGRLRGGRGAWGRGAYEYDGPLNVRIVQ